ncbi:MAG: DUF1565 domain-containing protein, partial [Planctomycetota bacterium]
MAQGTPSNFPNGFRNGVVIRGVPLTISHPGQVFWVNNSSVLAKGAVGGSDSNDGTYQRPFSTIDKAINSVTAGRGDVIMVMPGHIETILNATSIVPDTDHVAIVGLGTGNDRPTIKFNHANANIPVTGANVTFYNILFLSTITAVASGITAGASTTVSNCEFNWEATGDDFVQMINIDAVDGVVIEDNRFIAEDTGGCDQAIRLDTATDCVIRNNYIYGDFTDAAVISEGAASTNLEISGNFVYNSDVTAGSGFDLDVADTGVLTNNRCGSLFTTAPETTLDPG